MNRQRGAWFFGWLVTRKGSDTSGNYGHKGVKGRRGGSAPGGGHMAIGIVDPSEAKLLIQEYRERKAKEKAAKAKKEPTNVGRPADPNADHDEKGLKAYVGQSGATMLDSYSDPDFILPVGEYVNFLNQRKASLSYLSGIDESTVATAIRAWDRTSNDTDMRSLSLQEAASEELGVPLSDWQKQKIEGIRSGTIGVASERAKGVMDRTNERKLIRTMHDWTQAELKDAGYKPGDTIRLFRGVAADKMTPMGTPMDLEQNAISSWSINPGTAHRFAERAVSYNPFGLVLSMEVPIQNILSMAPTGFGVFREGEFVVMGTPGNQAMVTGVEA